MHEDSVQNRLHLLRLARTENVGPISFFHLLKRYGTAQEALVRLSDIMRRSPPKIPSMEDAKREVEAHEKKGLQLLCYYDSTYPAVLKTLKDAPPFLTLWGRQELLQKILFSMVGARNASYAGQRLATQLAEQLTARKWVMVSGLARGIDACVHRASLDAAGTVAVVAGGIGHVYPPEHKKLYEEIGEKGLLISEDPLTQQPYSSLFPKRNRLISGLSWGVMIVEASLRSGSLLTARYATDQGRTVLAAPGHPLDFRAQGTNRLIKQGAVLVETVDDILSEYEGSHRYLAEMPEEEYEALALDQENMTVLSQRIYEVLTMVPTTIQEISQHLAISPVMVRVCLVEMEINGDIQRYPGDRVMRA